MNTKKIAYLLVFSLFLGASGFAYGASEDTRYLVKSHSGFWKKSFGMRHDFKDGFTADLTDWQLRVARMFKIEVIPVKKLYILTSETESEVTATATPTPTLSPTLTPEIKAKPTPSAAPTRPLPSSQFSWGIKAVYGDDPLLTETSGGTDVNVAVLDSGVFKGHADLKNRVKQCKDFTAPKQPMVDGKCDDKNGHGTHVAGIIAADGGSDGKGIFGVAPQANIWAYKVCGTNGSCWSDDIAIAIKTASDNGANIINLSLGSDTESSLIEEAISYAVDNNVLVIAASGNDGPEVGSIDYPAANPNAVGVGAFDISYEMADWSSRGINSTTEVDVIEEGDIEFAAPGVIIESTWKDGGYVILSGTSMATPHISGLAAKLWQKDALDPDSSTRELLKQFSSDLNPVGEDDESGFGFPHL